MNYYIEANNLIFNELQIENYQRKLAIDKAGPNDVTGLGLMAKISGKSNEILDLAASVENGIIQDEKFESYRLVVEPIQNQFFCLLVNSIFPALSKNYVLKVLTLFTILSSGNVGLDSGPCGDPKNKTRDYSNFRKNLHLLVLGSEEDLKDSLLQWVASLDIKNNFIDNKKRNNGSGNSNLINTNKDCLFGCLEKNRDGFYDNWIQGEYNVSPDGICCINSIQKNHSILGFISLSMENRKIALNKKGFSVLAQTHGTFICTSELLNGKYNKKFSLKNNYRLDDHMWNRFDLIANLVKPHIGGFLTHNRGPFGGPGAGGILKRLDGELGIHWESGGLSGFRGFDGVKVGGLEKLMDIVVECMEQSCGGDDDGSGFDVLDVEKEIVNENLEAYHCLDKSLVYEF